jgi:hypothetical protein
MDPEEEVERAIQTLVTTGREERTDVMDDTRSG